MSTPRDPWAPDPNADDRAWSAQDAETTAVNGGGDRHADPTVAYGSGGAPAYGSDPTVAYGNGGAPAYGSDPTVSYGNSGTPTYGASGAPTYGNSGAPTYGSQPTHAYGSTGATPAAGAPHHPPTVQYPATAAWSTTSYSGPNTSTYNENTSGYGQVPHSGHGGPPPGDRGRTPVPNGGGGKTGRYVVIAFAVLVLLALLAALAWGLQSATGSNEDAVAPTPAVPTTTAPSTVPPTTSPGAQVPLPTVEWPTLPGLEGIPNLGEAIGGSGITIGSITSVNDSSIVVDGLGGSVTVVITPQTEVVGLNVASAGDLIVGESVVVEGTPVENGQTTATRIVSTRIPGN